MAKGLTGRAAGVIFKINETNAYWWQGNYDNIRKVQAWEATPGRMNPNVPTARRGPDKEYYERNRYACFRRFMQYP